MDQVKVYIRQSQCHSATGYQFRELTLLLRSAGKTLFVRMVAEGREMHPTSTYFVAFRMQVGVCPPVLQQHTLLFILSSLQRLLYTQLQSPSAACDATCTYWYVSSPPSDSSRTHDSRLNRTARHACSLEKLQCWSLLAKPCTYTHSAAGEQSRKYNLLCSRPGNTQR